MVYGDPSSCLNGHKDILCFVERREDESSNEFAVRKFSVAEVNPKGSSVLYTLYYNYYSYLYQAEANLHCFLLLKKLWMKK